jgi:hypothetical protein
MSILNPIVPIKISTSVKWVIQLLVLLMIVNFFFWNVLIASLFDISNHYENENYFNTNCEDRMND